MRRNLIDGAGVVVAVARVANGVFLTAVVVGLATSWALATQATALLHAASSITDPHAALPLIRAMLLVGIAMGIATDRLLLALGRIIAAARAGDPFVAGNAARLTTIGRALLVLQLLDIPCAVLARRPELGSAAPSGDVSLGGWMAVLLVFVLARVFRHGAAMRDDLAGTV